MFPITIDVEKSEIDTNSIYYETIYDYNIIHPETG